MTLLSIIPTPDIYQARRILCIQPHYDDNDIGAGGTLAMLHERGAEIIYLTITDDLMGVLDATLPSEAAAAQLKREQEQASQFIGVSQQYWLDYPDAGAYDYYELRRQIIRAIRLVKPDLLFSPDPWLAYEAHRDHVLTGQAAAEATTLYSLPRLPSDPDVDATYSLHEVLGIAFYYTNDPNTIVNISPVHEKKEEAVRCYQSQFSAEDMARLLMVLDAKERMAAEGCKFPLAEGLKVMHPLQLHCGL